MLAADGSGAVLPVPPFAEIGEHRAHHQCQDQQRIQDLPDWAIGLAWIGNVIERFNDRVNGDRDGYRDQCLADDSFCHDNSSLPTKTD